MEKTKDELKPKITFSNCSTSGDHIKALVDYYTNGILSEFELEQALREIKINNQLIKEFTQKLLNKEETQ